jgi:methylated-DNA-[protein]-cysteine S-methyltransferase
MAKPPIMDQYDALVATPFATLGLRVDAQANALTALHFLPASVAAKAPKKNTIAHLACVQLMSYLDHGDFVFDVPLKLVGSKHQLDVWQEMQAIPAGETRTYGEIAEAIGSNARAVGTACGKNPIPLIVPCHRIVAANGLGGFMGGKRDDPLAIKRWLLAHEGAIEGALADNSIATPSLF